MLHGYGYTSYSSKSYLVMYFCTPNTEEVEVIGSGRSSRPFLINSGLGYKRPCLKINKHFVKVSASKLHMASCLPCCLYLKCLTPYKFHINCFWNFYFICLFRFRVLPIWLCWPDNWCVDQGGIECQRSFSLSSVLG